MGTTGRGANNPAGEMVPKLGTIVPNLGTLDVASPLTEALFGSVRGRVLALLFGQPGRAFYTREIIAALGAGQGAVQRELRRLADAGALCRERSGRAVYYRANPDCPIYDELVSLVRKTLGLRDVLRSALAGLVDRIDVAFVFGSMAKGTSGAQSDVDVMVVGSVSFAEVVAALGPTEQILGREVNPSVYPTDEFRDRMASGDHFVVSILGEPILFLIGGQGDVGRLAGQRVAEGASRE
jgi:predicted nucleotidyltransferase